MAKPARIGYDILMDRVTGRRNVLKGTLALGAGMVAGGVSLAGRARAADVSSLPATSSEFSSIFGAMGNTAPVSPAAPILPPSPVGTPEYSRKILSAAQRQVSRVGASLWRTDIVGIADFSRPSWEPRLHFANLENGTVRSFLLAHGKGSDPAHSGWLQAFSDRLGSEATSRGAYLTCEWYNGKYGTSIRLKGLDTDNASALERAIVMHPAWYVDESLVQRFGKIGRSEGCFAMSKTDFQEALWRLSGGRLLFADRIV